MAIIFQPYERQTFILCLSALLRLQLGIDPGLGLVFAFPPGLCPPPLAFFCRGLGKALTQAKKSGAVQNVGTSKSSLLQYLKGKKKLYIGKEKTERRLVKKIDFISFIL
jgi:hypothetical protein